MRRKIIDVAPAVTVLDEDVAALVERLRAELRAAGEKAGPLPASAHPSAMRERVENAHLNQQACWPADATPAAAAAWAIVRIAAEIRMTAIVRSALNRILERSNVPEQARSSASLEAQRLIMAHPLWLKFDRGEA